MQRQMAHALGGLEKVIRRNCTVRRTLADGMGHAAKLVKCNNCCFAASVNFRRQCWGNLIQRRFDKQVFFGDAATAVGVR
jgi:hypothetical protein